MIWKIRINAWNIVEIVFFSFKRIRISDNAEKSRTNELFTFFIVQFEFYPCETHCVLPNHFFLVIKFVYIVDQFEHIYAIDEKMPYASR